MADDILGDYQVGFRQNRSTPDQIFILKTNFPENVGVQQGNACFIH